MGKGRRGTGEREEEKRKEKTRAPTGKETSFLRPVLTEFSEDSLPGCGNGHPVLQDTCTPRPRGLYTSFLLTQQRLHVLVAVASGARGLRAKGRRRMYPSTYLPQPRSDTRHFHSQAIGQNQSHDPNHWQKTTGNMETSLDPGFLYHRHRHIRNTSSF